MNKGGFSWRKFLGVSGFKSRIARLIGIPFTKSGRQRKLGAYIEHFATWLIQLLKNVYMGP